MTQETKITTAMQKRSSNLKVRVQDKAEKIISKSIKIFAKKGYAQSSIREIAGETNINAGVLYNYIKNKEDILVRIFQMFHDQRQSRFAKADIPEIQDPEEQLRAAIRTAMEYFKISGDENLIVYREMPSLPKSAAAKFIEQEKSFVSIFEQIVRRGTERQVFHVKNPLYAANVIVYLLSIHHLRNMYLKDLFTTEDIVELTEDYILNALRTGNHSKSYGSIS